MREGKTEIERDRKRERNSLRNPFFDTDRQSEGHRERQRQINIDIHTQIEGRERDSADAGLSITRFRKQLRL